MSQIRPVIFHGLNKFLDNCPNALRAAGGFGEMSQSRKQGLEHGFFWGMESLANHLVDLFPDTPTLEGYPFVAPLNLEF